jgi:hypothetical protein
MVKLSRVRVDVQDEREGRWFPWKEDAALKVAAFRSPEYREEVRRALKVARRESPTRTLTADQTLDALKPAAARHLLRDWRGIEGDDGQPLSYSPELALEWFNDPELHHLYAFVLDCAGDVDGFLREQDEADLGN